MKPKRNRLFYGIVTLIFGIFFSPPQTIGDPLAPEPFGFGGQAGDQKTLTVNGVDFVFRWCPPGEFLMGSPDSEEGRDQDEMRHRVRLTRGYWILETEVTQEMWQCVMGNEPEKSTLHGWEGSLYPAHSIDWHEAQNFCAELQKLAGHDALIRIPTEAEWEYACRAGSVAEGSADDLLDTSTWYRENSGGQIHQVKEKAPNPWGLYDMLGNVAEWCSDLKEPYTNFSETNPVGSEAKYYEIHRGTRVYRGGEVRSTAKRCRAADRCGADSKYSSPGLGFRPVLVPSAEFCAQEAEQGNSEAQYCLALCYAGGEGVDRDDEKALNWLRRAAEQGHAEAEYSLGTRYAEGRGLDPNDEEAVKWYREAAQQEHAEAQLTLGNCLAEGVGTDQDDEEAVKWFRKAAEKGLAEAEFALGFCYKYGRGVEQDEAESAKWYSKTSEQFHPDSLYKRGFLSYMPLLHWNTRISNVPTESAICHRMAAELGHPKSAFCLGKCYYFGRGVREDHVRAAQWFLEAAQRNDIEGQSWIAKCYRDGDGIEQNYTEALKWFEKAGEQGDLESQKIVANCYMHSDVVEQDPAEGAKWLRMAADQGDPESQFQLADCYSRGIGVEDNPQEAVKWYQKAAQQGHVRTQFAMGFRCALGFGIEKSNPEAVKWLRLALNQDPEYVNEMIQGIESFFTFDPEILSELGIESEPVK